MEVISDYGSLPVEVRRQFAFSPILTLVLINGITVVVPIALPANIERTLAELEEKAGEGLVE